MLEISSRDNKLFKDLLALTESKGLKKSERFLVFGSDITQEYISLASQQILSEIYTDGIEPLLPKKNWVKLSTALFKELDVLGTKARILVVEMPRIETLEVSAFSSLPEGLHVLLPLGDPGNLGAAMRSAAALGAQSVIFLNESANPFLPKSVKAAAGAHLRLNMHFGPSVHDLARMETQVPLLVLDQNGTSVRNFVWPKKCFLLVGEEGAGIPSNIKSQVLSIPIHKVESLNANVALSIALYEYSQRIHGQKRD